jgi:hypothetical protein
MVVYYYHSNQVMFLVALCVAGGAAPRPQGAHTETEEQRQGPVAHLENCHSIKNMIQQTHSKCWYMLGGFLLHPKRWREVTSPPPWATLDVQIPLSPEQRPKRCFSMSLKSLM